MNKVEIYVNENELIKIADIIIDALINAGPNNVIRAGYKFDEPDLRAVIYETLNIETEE